MTRRHHRLLYLGILAAWALGWAGTAGAASPTLRQCQADLGFCNTTLTQTQTSLGTCTNELAACEATCETNTSAFPASGQTTAYTAVTIDIPTNTEPDAVPDDGTVQAGAALSYTDNGDGTITDNNTGLMWEKKSDDSHPLHDKDGFAFWSGNGIQETLWDWLEKVNAEGGSGFAGYNDWRIPNVKELQSIVNYQNRLPAVSSAFDNNCAGETVVTGSCTLVALYWSSTSVASGAISTSAWVVDFSTGAVAQTPKNTALRVRCGAARSSRAAGHRLSMTRLGNCASPALHG